MNIIKRNGDVVLFNVDKIATAVMNAMSETEKGVDQKLASQIATDIKYHYQTDIVRTADVESVQDMVEEHLLNSERKDVAKAYILYREKRNQLRNKKWEMSELQRDIYEKKYRFENETFGEFLDRVSNGNTAIRKLIQEQKFSFAGRTLASRGLRKHGKKITYANCFVLTPPEDNLESIFEVSKKMARTYSMGGGVGITLENLRPKGSRVNNSARETTGAVSFMDLYSTVTGLIGQAGRRGALMISLPIDHPDIEEFIDVKKDLDRVNFANISIMINDKFMEAVENDEDWVMRFKVKDTGEIIEKSTKARYLFRKIAENNHQMAEPGILYWDRVQNWHINSEVEEFRYSSTNP